MTLAPIYLALISLISACDSSENNSNSNIQYKQPTLGYSSDTDLIELTVDGLKFKDMNRNNKLDIYEDWRLDSLSRAKNLVSLMSDEEKAGVMMHGTLPLTSGTLMEGTVDFPTLTPYIQERMINTFITRMAGDPSKISSDNNHAQMLAEKTRLAIPITISTDPRNHFKNDPKATSIAAGSFSQWPETLGFGALDDSKIMQEFGDIVRQEYRSVGIQMALSPQADLSTEPRWGRTDGTFGEDNQIAKRMVEAYIKGFQNGSTGLNKDSVITVVKHFSGGGSVHNGLDSHNIYGKDAVFPGDNFDYHLVPFEGAFAANAASVMPYYSRPLNLTYNGKTVASLIGEKIEPVGFGFNKQILQDILRDHYRFDGVVLSDWGILDSCTDEMKSFGPGISASCMYGLNDAAVDAGLNAFMAGIGMSWGVEDLTRQERAIKGVLAGINQFGGSDNPTELLNAITEAKAVSNAENQQFLALIDDSAVRVLKQKFDLGLFENPYVDEQKALEVVGNQTFQALGNETQKRSHVLLKNEGILALPVNNNELAGKKAYIHKINPVIAAQYGLIVVDSPEKADIAIIRIDAPYQTDPHFPFGMLHFGQLAYVENPLDVIDERPFQQNYVDPINVSRTKYSGHEDLLVMKAVKAAKIPTITSVYLDRPAILTNIVDKTDVLLVNFGSTDKNFFDLLVGMNDVKPEGKLPFELPSTWQAVLDQKEDLPSDTADPLYEKGAGIILQ